MKKLVMCAALLLAPALVLATPDVPVDLAGPYQSSIGQQIDLVQVAPGLFKVYGDRWEGGGTFDGTTYKGVFRMIDAIGPGITGTHTGVLLPGGKLSVHVEYQSGGRSYDMVWTRVATWTLRSRPPHPLPHAR